MVVPLHCNYLHFPSNSMILIGPIIFILLILLIVSRMSTFIHKNLRFQKNRFSSIFFTYLIQSPTLNRLKQPTISLHSC